MEHHIAGHSAEGVVDKFKSVCFMTATPTPRKYFPPEVSKLDYIRLVWEGSSVMHIKKAKMQGDVTSKVVAICLHHLDTEGTPLFFYNSLRGIVPCVKQLIKARGLSHKDIKIICADNERNRAYLKDMVDHLISEYLAYKEYKTTMNDHERIEHLEDTVKWMVQNDLNLQKESDQSKN